MKKIKFALPVVSLVMFILANHKTLAGTYTPEFSTAGYYCSEKTGREVFDMNPAWKMHKGDMENAQNPDFDDSSWKKVNLPDGIELLPEEGSGCINYRGIVWYRKHFDLQSDLKGKRLFIYFEGIMGKSEIWINGMCVKKHFGGYLPIVADITDFVFFDKENIMAVKADNSNDGSYPPGKPQETLDFTYCGGIYRDCFLISHGNIFITDPNYENEIAGGGVFVSYDNVSEKSADIHVKTHVRNMEQNNFRGKIVWELFNSSGKKIYQKEKAISINKSCAETFEFGTSLKNPDLWSPDTPNLHKLKITIKKGRKPIDGFYMKIGIRSIEFKGADGLWINGKKYGEPLIGANRHQDYAVIGNALSNGLHLRDAKKLRDAGLKVIRNAHYPQDPAFMDACDELGLFVIVNTPGWQFWNNDPIFASRVYDDIRNMVRRDRNRASLFFWEPILNETHYPGDFVQNAVNIIKEEYPYNYCYCACDSFAEGKEKFQILYRHPDVGGGSDVKEDEVYSEGINYFTREWGDNVDDWNSHNSPSRVHRSWGEHAMLIQARGYAKPDYKYTCYDSFYNTPLQHFGGCLWHPFDHQRGYHPDPFYGGIMDAYRQPKYSYYMMKSQRPVSVRKDVKYETGPMIFIANELTPFSPKDVTVYSNCPEVRLTFCTNGTTYTYKKKKTEKGMPSPIITFKNVTDVMKDKEMSRSGQQQDYYLLAEGMIDGKVVASHKVSPARRAVKIVLSADTEGTNPVANGQDMITVIAHVTDRYGNIKRLNNQTILFEISGEGVIMGDEKSGTNPKKVEWGTAPVIVRTTTKPGKIRIKASVTWRGANTPEEGILEMESIAPKMKMIYKESDLGEKKSDLVKKEDSSDISGKQAGRNFEKQLEEVEKQQADFENNN